MASAKTVYTTKERIDIIELYIENGRSAAATLRKFKAKYGQSVTLTLTTITKLYEKWSETGSVTDDKASMTGRPVTVTTPEAVEKVRDLYAEAPTTSTTKASQMLGMSRRSLGRVMKEQLKLFPYKIQVQQPLSAANFQQRLDFANVILGKVDKREIDPRKMWFSDEAHFHVDGYVNKQNYRHWGTENPHLATVRSLHPQRVTVWCAIGYYGIIGPYFLTGTINGAIYNELILKKFFAEVRAKNSVNGFWFQQDGARPHRTANNLQAIADVFQERIIGLDAEKFTGGGIDWPPYSCDLTPPDYFLWGYVKDQVYKEGLPDLETLKERVATIINGISDEMRHRVCDAFITRLRHLIVSEGGHFENLIY